MTKIKDQKDFIKEITAQFGEYKNPAQVYAISLYLHKYINPERLNDLYWLVMRYYNNKVYPPNVGDIDKAIRDGVHDELEKNPRKQKKVNPYTGGNEKLSSEEYERVASTMRNIKKSLGKKGEPKNENA